MRSLRDGSALPVIDNSLSTFGLPDVGFYSTCTVMYQAGRARQQLVVELTLTKDGAGGNVALAATLHTRRPSRAPEQSRVFRIVQTSPNRLHQRRYGR